MYCIQASVEGEGEREKLTAPNSYILAFHVDKAWDKYKFHAPNLVKLLTGRRRSRSAGDC